MQEEIEITEIPWGIGCRIGNTIYLNEHLKEEPKLYDAILNHEKEHTSGFSIKDIKMDLRNHHLKGLKTDYFRWIMSNPRSLTEFLPFGVYNHKFIINPLTLAFYGAFMTILGTIWGVLWR